MADAERPARFDRLYEALKVLLVQESFALTEVKERLPHEIPSYVTQLVHQLEREGHLRDNAGVYSWTCELGDFPAQSWVQAQVHGTQIPMTPEEDRPRERLLARGPASLRTAELLAIVIRAGRPGVGPPSGREPRRGVDVVPLIGCIGECAQAGQRCTGVVSGHRLQRPVLPREPGVLPAHRCLGQLAQGTQGGLRRLGLGPPDRRPKRAIRTGEHGQSR
jgi:hypothetical protein